MIYEFPGEKMSVDLKFKFIGVLVGTAVGDAIGMYGAKGLVFVPKKQKDLKEYIRKLAELIFSLKYDEKSAKAPSGI